MGSEPRDSSGTATRGPLGASPELTRVTHVAKTLDCRWITEQLVELGRPDLRLPVATVGAFRTGKLAEHLATGTARQRFILVGELAVDELAAAKQLGLLALLGHAATEAEICVTVDGALELLDAQQRNATHGERLSRFEYEIDELIDIARALTKERDIVKLLGLILEKSRFITGADAGSIYVVEDLVAPKDSETHRQTLHFKQTQNDSLHFDSSEFQVPVSRSSMAGWVVLERQSIRIADVYELPQDSPFGFDRSFDAKTGYRTKSMLCAPLVGSRGDVIGVLQLINKKHHAHHKLSSGADVHRWVVPFDERSEQLLLTLAAQAGIALENAMLIEEIQGLFEGFVRASVEAIESRDPTTSGHSLRVARLTLGLAEAVNRTEVGLYGPAHLAAEELRELEYASLLHDFGKIGVREPVLVKAKKLYPHELEAIRLRIELGLREIEVQRYSRQLEIRERGGSLEELRVSMLELDAQRSELEQAYATVMQAAEPSVLRAQDQQLLDAVERLTLRRMDGTSEPLLSHLELASLRIERGSLTPAEFEEIRSHVVHTQRFLSRIPWGRTLRRVPEIAGAHHERLDGTGYPRGCRAPEIPLQSKLMSIADIYDALTASDRPYKRAVTPERALHILELEVRDGHLDAELVKLFQTAQVWVPRQ